MEEPSRSQANPSQQAPGSTLPVLIAGGGFGGLYTALALASHRHHPPILLVEPQERFLFLPLLYELLSEELRGWEVAPATTPCWPAAEWPGCGMGSAGLMPAPAV